MNSCTVCKLTMYWCITSRLGGNGTCNGSQRVRAREDRGERKIRRKFEADQREKREHGTSPPPFPVSFHLLFPLLSLRCPLSSFALSPLSSLLFCPISSLPSLASRPLNFPAPLPHCPTCPPVPLEPLKPLKKSTMN